MVEKYKYNKSLSVCCDGCDNTGREVILLDLLHKEVFLCSSCLTTLRSKIDALSILVQTGMDTKEKGNV
jgi:hypothetical protein